MNSVILKHVSVFALKQLVARILSNKYIWLLLKYKATDELGTLTHSDPWRKNAYHITRDGVWKQTIMRCLAIPFIVSINSDKKSATLLKHCYIRINSLFYSCKLKNNVKLYKQLFLLALNSINRAIC